MARLNNNIISNFKQCFFYYDIFEKSLQLILIFVQLFLKSNIKLYYYCFFTYNIFRVLLFTLLIKLLNMFLY